MGVVFERLNRFLEMLHDLRLPRTGQASELDVSRRNHERADSVFQPYREPLKSGFPIPEELMPEGPAEPVVQPENSRLLKYFDELATGLAARFSVEWTAPITPNISAKAMRSYRTAGCWRPTRTAARRRSTAAVSLGLRTTHGGRLLLRCTSPLGTVYQEQFAEVIRLQRAKPHFKVCAEHGRRGRLVLSRGANRSALLPRDHTAGGIGTRFGKTLVGADEIELELFQGKDHTAAELGVVGEEDAKHGPD